MSPLAHARANENKLENVGPTFFKFLRRFWKAVFICLNLSHRLIVSEVLKLCALGTFYVDLQCTLISGHCTGRELTTATPQ